MPHVRRQLEDALQRGADPPRTARRAGVYFSGMQIR
jgi:hypothetical protein